MSLWSAHLVHTIFDSLRYVLWMTISGFAVVGAAFYGGSSVHAIWQRNGPPSRRRRDPVTREAEAGIAEIEAFLRCRSPEPGTREAPPPAERHRRPPASGDTA